MCVRSKKQYRGRVCGSALASDDDIHVRTSALDAGTAPAVTSPEVLISFQLSCCPEQTLTWVWVGIETEAA